MLREFANAARQLGRSPSFLVLPVAAIALGIGANTALFSIVRAVILEPLPFAEPDRLMLVWETRPDRGRFNNVVSNANYLDWRARNQVFDAMSPLFRGSTTLLGSGQPEQIQTQQVGEDFFPMLGVRMAMGRSSTAEECRAGAPVAAVLSDSLWRTRFAGDPQILGRTVRLGADAATVVGVAPAGLLAIGERTPLVWTNARVAGVSANGTRAAGRNMMVLARLKRGVSPAEADRQMVAIAKQLEQEYPAFNAQWSARVAPLADEYTGKARTPLYFLMGAVACVLLIACSNAANLLLMRSTGRAREFAVRISLGATRGHLVRQLLAESLSISLAGAALGVPLGWVLLDVLKIIGPTDVQRMDRAALDGGVLAFTAGLTMVTGLLVGLAPAWQASRGTPGMAMRDGGRGTTGSARAGWLRDVFTVGEVALALLLLVGAGLLLKSFGKLLSVEPGFQAEQVLTANVSLPGNRYSGEQGPRFFAELNRRVRALPGVADASNVTFLPLQSMGSATYHWRADRPKPAPGQEPVADVRMVQPRYFETMRIPLRSGRTFSDADAQSSAPLRFVINDAMAQALFPGEDPVGKRIVVQMQAQNPPAEIIGVTGNVRSAGLDAQVRPMVYYPQSHLFFNFGTVVVRTQGEPAAMGTAVSAVIHEMDPELAVSQVGTMQHWVEESVARPRFQAQLLAGFAGLALLLAMVGIYGVISYGVAQRTHEIGVRMALGARREDVARLVLGKGAQLAGAGLIIGTVLALALGRRLETLLFEVQPADPATLAGMAVLLFLVAMGASYIPALRATRVDPAQCLRHD